MPSIWSAFCCRPVCRFPVETFLCFQYRRKKCTGVFSIFHDYLNFHLFVFILDYSRFIEFGLGLRTLQERAGELGVVRIGSGAYRSARPSKRSEALRGYDPFYHFDLLLKNNNVFLERSSSDRRRPERDTSSRQRGPSPKGWRRVSIHKHTDVGRLCVDP